MLLYFLSIVLAVIPHTPTQAQPFLQQGFADIIEPCLDAVVNISATFPQPLLPPLELHLPEGMWGDVKEFLPFSKGASRNVTALGSGFIIDPSGYIVTNVHVVQNVLEGKGRINVILNSGKELAVKIVGIDPRSDLALLKAKTEEPLPCLSWGDSSKARIGDWVLAVGNPFGLGGTVTSGIISNAQRSMPEKIGDATHVDQWLQTDAPINEGSSGGPLIDMRGKVIGINTAIFSPSRGGNVGIAFAIPEKVARDIIEQLKKTGVVKRGWIGIKLGPFVTPEIAKTMGLSALSGVLVDGVVPQKGADKAGIETGDIILKVGDISVTSVFHLRSLVSGAAPGDTLTLTLLRPHAEGSGRTWVAKVSVGDLESDHETLLPKIEKPAPSKKVLGMVLAEARKVPQRLQRQWGWPAAVAKGVVIVKAEGKEGQKLRSGDVILKVGMRLVSSPSDIVRLLKEARKNTAPGKTALLLVWRPEEGEFHHVLQLYDDENES